MINMLMGKMEIERVGAKVDLSKREILCVNAPDS